MSSLRSLFLLPALLALAACGFEPLYGTQGGTASPALAAIAVDPIPERDGQLLKMHFEDEINPAGAASRKRYGLAVSLNKTLVPALTRSDGQVLRYNVQINSHFRLYDKLSGAELYAGDVNRTGSYNVAVSDFSSFISERDVAQRILKELAVDYRLRLSAFFAKSAPQTAPKFAP